MTRKKGVFSRSDDLPSGRALFKTSVVLTSFNVVSRTIGLLIPIVIARWYGVSRETDAFFFGYAIILFVTGVFSAVAEAVIVPYTAELRRTSEESVAQFLREVTAIATLVVCLVTALVVATLSPLLGVVTRFSAGDISTVRQILIEASILPPVVLLASLYAGTLNTYHHYGVPVISQAVRSIVAIGIIVVFQPTFGIHAIVVGYVLGEICRFVMVSWFARQCGVFAFSLRVRSTQRIRGFFSVASYHVFSMLVMGLTPVTDKFVSSWLPPGSVSVIEYANKLYVIPVTLATSGFTVVLLSHWSNRQYADPKFDLWKDAQRSVLIIGAGGVVLTLGCLLLAPALIAYLLNFKSGFSQYSSEILSTFRAYSIGLSPYLLSQVYVRGLLVFKQTKNLFLIAIVLCIINLILDVVFMRIIGVTGIALSTTAVSLLSWILHLRVLRRVAVPQHSCSQ
jgi:putative peptidoglycan lipid II flippase